jgi:hypothetical protein
MPDGSPTAAHAKETTHRQQLEAPVLEAPVALFEEGLPLALSVQRAMVDPGRLRPTEVLALQRTAGNRVVSRLIQPKLTVGPVGDRYEQEADRVAEQVLAMPVVVRPPANGGHAQRQLEEEEVQPKSLGLPRPLAASITSLIQRQEDEEEVQTKPAAQYPISNIQRRGDGGFEAGPALEGRLAARKGGGSPLPGDVRGFMEPRFGADFSGVRVHTGGEAAQLSKDLSAQAFTHGQDIYLGSGKYDPGTTAGKRLLAHELTHVVQQNAGQVTAVQDRPFVQRASLTSSGDFQSKLADFTGVLVQVAKLLDDYNAIADDTSKYQDRLNILHQLDGKIYEWFKTHPSPDLSKSPDAKVLKDLLEESEAEHQEIIHAIKTDKSVLPIDPTDLEKADVNLVRSVWQSMVAGSGNIKVRGDEGFNKKTFARLAKILQTKTGRDLLSYLNQSQKTGKGRDDRIIILPTVKGTEFEHIEEGRTSESSYAYSLKHVTDKKDTSHEFQSKSLTSLDTGLPELSSAPDLTQAILEGKSGVKSGGKKLEFGEGSGALVKIVDKPNKKHKMAGEGDKEVLDPGFVTLAHELGHAFKIRAGAKALKSDSSILEALEPDTIEQDLWSKDPEEFINVMGIENMIREQSGIHKRKYHKPLESVIAIRRKEGLKGQLNAILSKDPFVYQIPEYETVSQDFNSKMNALTDDGVYQDLKDSIENVSKLMTDEKIRDWKKADITQRLDEAIKVVSEEDYSTYVIGTAEQVTFGDTLRSRMAEFVGVGNNSLYDFRKLVRDFAKEIPNLVQAGKAEEKLRKKQRRKAKTKRFFKGLVSFGRWK